MLRRPVGRFWSSASHIFFYRSRPNTECGNRTAVLCAHEPQDVMVTALINNGEIGVQDEKWHDPEL
jgi:hypothetical protein